MFSFVLLFSYTFFPLLILSLISILHFILCDTATLQSLSFLCLIPLSPALSCASAILEFSAFIHLIISNLLSVVTCAILPQTLKIFVSCFSLPLQVILRNSQII